MTIRRPPPQIVSPETLRDALSRISDSRRVLGKPVDLCISFIEQIFRGYLIYDPA